MERYGFKSHRWIKCVLLLILPVAMLLSQVLGRPKLNPLRGCWVSMRKLFLFGFSAATSYQLKPELDKSIYNRVSQEILDCINALRSELESENSPVVIIAHSLGCHVISNYIWDAQKGTGFWKDVEPGTTPFQKLDTTAYMFTAGCNIPLFVAGYEKIAAVRKPNPGFQWINYYDRDDVLGYPLRPLSTGFDNSYDAVVTSDEPINVGNILEFWNPASHTGYWEHSIYIKPVADRINALHAKLQNPRLTRKSAIEGLL